MKKYTSYLVLFALLCSGCVGIPKDALQLSPQSLAERQIQTRRFETTNNAEILRAASAVLQDLGFTLEESEIPLGVLVGSKDRDATSGAQIAGAILLGVLSGVPQAVDKTQTIRVSMVMRAIENNTPEKADAHAKLTREEIIKIRNTVKREIAAGLRKHYPADVSQKVAEQSAQSAADALTKNLLSVALPQGRSGQSTVRITFQRVIFNTMGQVTLAEQIKDPVIYQKFFEKLSKSVFLEAHEI